MHSRVALSFFSVLLSLPTALRAQEIEVEAEAAKSTPRESVHGAVLDYVEALYDVAPERIERSVSPKLVKFGFARKTADQPYRALPMTHEQLLKLASSWNKAGDQAGDDARKQIDVLYVGHRIALAKLTAQWGMDYMHLVRQGDRWQILQVLWQTVPAGGKYLPPDDEVAAVKAAVEDYLLGFYEAAPERIDRSVDQNLAKFGFYGPPQGKEAPMPMPMTFAQLRSLAASLHKRQPPPDDAPREIQVLDVLDTTAAVRLTAHWGTDLMQLAKTDGKWRIRHVVWESGPAVAQR
jgi:hypothetical protein